MITLRPYTKRGRTGWEVDLFVHFPDGLPPYRKRRKSPFPTEKASQAWAEKLEREIYKQGRPLSRKEKEKSSTPLFIPTLQAFAKRYLDEAILGEGLAQSTHDLREGQLGTYLLPLFGHLSLDKIGAECFSQLKAQLRYTIKQTDRSHSHTNEIVGLLYRMLCQAKDWEIPISLPRKPKRLREITKEPEIYSAEEFSRLVAASSLVGWQAHVTVLLGGDAGLRVGELLGLRFTDVDLGQGYLVVRQQEVKPGEVKPPKSKQSRRVKLTKRLWAALKEARKKHAGERVLIRTDGGSMSRYQIKAWLRQSERKAELVGSKSPHKLRHTCASLCLERNASPKDIQALLGHSSLATTLRYLHLSPGGADRAVEKLEGNGLGSGAKLETRE